MFATIKTNIPSSVRDSECSVGLQSSSQDEVEALWDTSYSIAVTFNPVGVELVKQRLVCQTGASNFIFCKLHIKVSPSVIPPLHFIIPTKYLPFISIYLMLPPAMSPR